MPCLQDLIKAAAEEGTPKIMEILLSQKLFKEDKDELDEAVDTALKAAAELGKVDVVDVVLKGFPDQAKEHCKAATFRAMKWVPWVGSGPDYARLQQQ